MGCGRHGRVPSLSGPTFDMSLEGLRPQEESWAEPPGGTEEPKAVALNLCALGPGASGESERRSRVFSVIPF